MKHFVYAILFTSLATMAIPHNVQASTPGECAALEQEWLAALDAAMRAPHNANLMRKAEEKESKARSCWAQVMWDGSHLPI